MTREAILFIVLPANKRTQIESRIYSNIIEEGRQKIVFVSDEIARELVSSVKSVAAARLVREIEGRGARPGDRIVLHREVTCSVKMLRKLWVEAGHDGATVSALSPKEIIQKAEDYSKSNGTFWLNYFNMQLDKYSFNKISANEWLGQFGELGLYRIGKHLSSQFRVIDIKTISPDPFGLNASDQYGMRQVYCYIKDDDLGGSWNEIRSLLTHKHSVDRVGEVIFDKRNETISFPDRCADELVLCEDGLWSGAEAIKRLKIISKKTIPQNICLKFGVVSDFGLSVVRNSIRHLGLEGKVRIDASRSNLIRFLRSDTPESAKAGIGNDSARFFLDLHKWVEPLAFRNFSNIAEGSVNLCEDITVCENINRQLVENWLERKNGCSPAKQMIDKFALGGGGFASTIFFSRSIPKVCMPLFWLDGEVSVKGKKIKWKPLLVDSRRIGDGELLIS